MNYHFHPMLNRVVQLIVWVCKHYPQKIVAQPFIPAKVRLGRKSHIVGPDGKATSNPGIVRVSMSPEACENLKSKTPDVWIIIRIRRSAAKRFESPIQTPNEAERKIIT